LEFDHVITIGLSGDATRHGMEPGDVALEELRRLLAMAIGRAKKSIVVGYKPSEATALVKYFKQGTFDLVRV
jgi:superfamily I DNA/RNA helicase